MVYHRDFKFENTPPSVEEFIAKINEITGLEVIYGEFEIKNPHYPSDNFYYTYEKDNILSLTVFGYYTVNYLLGVAMYALVKLGGDPDGEFIPAWASLKWEDIKDKVDRLPNYPYPYPKNLLN
ncbi:hypothetical protein [Xanthocytophaga flava]|uniref:hypothetical protein n=1 Tax=Xanthocytophaga flava TaxID=3048013 RepID=UPI0028D585A0|nr:hypothetical protein [Xanthocytophaga flavus]MDJ1471144.1 hypothetical protein [Xanthocytophaga flavus]